MRKLLWLLAMTMVVGAVSAVPAAASTPMWTFVHTGETVEELQETEFQEGELEYRALGSGFTCKLDSRADIALYYGVLHAISFHECDGFGSAFGAADCEISPSPDTNGFLFMPVSPTEVSVEDLEFTVEFDGGCAFSHPWEVSGDLTATPEMGGGGGILTFALSGILHVDAQVLEMPAAFSGGLGNWGMHEDVFRLE